MRILTISNCPLVESEGSGYVVLNFCQGLREAGHTVDAFGPEDFEILKVLHPRARSYRQAVGWAMLAGRQIRDNSYDVVEFYGGQSWLTCCLFARIKRRRFLLVAHTNGPESLYEASMSSYFGAAHRKWYQLGQSRITQPAFTRVDGIITVSEFAKEWCDRVGYKTRFGSIAINNSLPSYYLSRKYVPRHTSTIGFCGNWTLVKGANVFAVDVSRILREFQNVRVKVIGAEVGQVLGAFPEDVSSRVEVVARIKDKRDLPQIYETLDILVMPSIVESFGLVAAEAMACGCALVSTKVGFAASLVDRQDALLIDRAISPLIYQRLRELITHDDLRRRLSENAPKRVQHLRWSDAIEKLNATYLEWTSRWQMQFGSRI